MQKVILVTLMMTLFCFVECRGQLINAFGAKVAVTSAIQNFDYTYAPGLPTTRKVGFNIAAFVEWFNIPHLSLVSQIEFAQRGMRNDFIVTGPSGPQPIGTWTVYAYTDYLSIPVLAKVRVQVGQVTPYLLAGPRIDFLLRQRSDDDVFRLVYDKFKRKLIGGSAGAGVQIESLLPVAILIEARYNFDFTDSYHTEFLKVRNNAFDIWIGVAF